MDIYALDISIVYSLMCQFDSNLTTSDRTTADFCVSEANFSMICVRRLMSVNMVLAKFLFSQPL